MMFLIFLSAFILVKATPTTENCNGVALPNSTTLYEREVLKTGLHTPLSLVMDQTSEILYLSYYIPTKISYSPIAATVDLKDKKFKNITSVPKGYTIAIDSTNNEVYIGSSKNGIYKYNHENDTAELYAAKDRSIWNVYFHNDLYYWGPAQHVFVFTNGKNIRLKELDHMEVKAFVIGKDDELFYSNHTGLYSQKRDTKDAQLYETPIHSRIRCLTTDNNRIVYACVNDGIYLVNKDAQRLDKILKIRDLSSLAFDRNNNLIYSDASSIYMLKPNENLTC